MRLHSISCPLILIVVVFKEVQLFETSTTTSTTPIPPPALEVDPHHPHHYDQRLKENKTCTRNEGTLVNFLNYVNIIVKDMKDLAQSYQLNSRYRAMDCADLEMTARNNGVYRIWPRNRVVQGPVDVMCDMEDDGGGWTIVQRRGDFNSSVDYFYRDWHNFKSGFGEVTKDFWIGNDVIYALTNQRPSMIKFVLTDWDGNSTWASYDNFWIDDEAHNYAVHVDGYRGTAGDSFKYSNGAGFTTKDRKNDMHESNCAQKFQGAWWHIACHLSNLNGMNLKGVHDSYANGVNWKSFKGYHYSLKDTFMKIRPKNYVRRHC